MADANKINAVVLAMLMFACGLMAQARFNVLSQSCSGCTECKTRDTTSPNAVKPEPNRPRPGPPS